MQEKKMDLQLFAGNTNLTTDTTATTGNDLSAEMKTYYADYLIDLAEPELVHDQFGQKHPIPQGGGKTVAFRKYDSLPKALSPLSEGVTPDGQKMNVSTVESTVHQYGGFVELSDMLLLTAVDNNLLEATRLIAGQAGRTLDTITRDVITAGTNVQSGAGDKLYRYKLTGGGESGNDYLSVTAVKRAVRTLKKMNAARINGDYVAIIHPDVAYDLTEDPKWINVKTYCDPADMYEGEIGKLEGVRFVENAEAKIFHAPDLTAARRTLTVKSYAAGVVTLAEALDAAAAAALSGRRVLIAGQCFTVSAAAAGAANAATLTLTETPTVNPAENDVVYPGEAGAAGRDVYATMILGANAYGVTEVAGGGLSHIVKQLGSAGTADPLDQRATVGWKATKTAERLVEQYMVRVETVSTFNDGAAN